MDTPIVEEITNSIIPPTQTKESGRTDDKIWADILKLQLDGVMMHVALFEHFCIKGIKGYAAMHKHHAEEEFEHYLHVAGDYMNTYKKLADMTNVSQPIVQIDGTTMEEIMMKGMEVYENWEKKVCEHLKKYQSELKGQNKKIISKKQDKNDETLYNSQEIDLSIFEKFIDDSNLNVKNIFAEEDKKTEYKRKYKRNKTQDEEE